MTTKSTITLCDDHPIVLGGLRNLIESEPDFEITGTATDGLAALRLIIDKRPDIAVQLLFQRENLLETAMFKEMVQSAVVPDADVQAYYDSHQADFATITARHILISLKPAVPAITLS